MAAENIPENVRIRDFSWRTDREQVLRFQYEIYETNFPGCTVDRSFIRDYSLNLRDAARNPDERLIVLEEDGRIVGFLWLSLMSTLVDLCVGYIKNIYVAPHLRGRGYGANLLAVADEWFRSNGASKATLDASVGNERAVGLYLRDGYEVTRYRMEKQYKWP
jgi:ribosomal protein S18 acetylase RimI-like enzyme